MKVSPFCHILSFQFSHILLSKGKSDDDDYGNGFADEDDDDTGDNGIVNENSSPNKRVYKHTRVSNYNYH